MKEKKPEGQLREKTIKMNINGIIFGDISKFKRKKGLWGGTKIKGSESIIIKHCIQVKI